METYFKAKHSLFPNADYEYSPGQTVTVTMDAYTPVLGELTWTQDDNYLNSGTISFSPITDIPSGATATYTYGANDVSTDAANGSFSISSLEYAQQTLTLTVSVDYYDFVTSSTSSITFEPEQYFPELGELTWTQSGTDYLNSGLSWSPITDIPSGATATYTYSNNNPNDSGSKSVSSSDAANGSVVIPSVQYAVQQIVTLTVSVTYCGSTTSDTASVSFNPEMPELGTTFTYTKGTPYDYNGELTGLVSCQLALTNGYVGTGDFVKVTYRTNGSAWNPGYTSGFDASNPFQFDMAIPGIKELRVQLTATIANGTFPDATKTSDWIYDAGITWVLKPTITLDSAVYDTVYNKSTITYTIKNNGSNLTGTMMLAIPTSSTSAPSIVKVDNGPFEWSTYGMQGTQQIATVFDFNVFPTGSTSKNDISVLIGATNGEGFSYIEQNLCP